ncbi:MAG: succinate dehydrogenase cytochrome b subunit [Bacteroidales bacterium]|nr:succinate dehydrogenase cytochrome b subunit [Bacteroidales bacterium]MBN2817842.1 succinate dehydrogenase cytochrome b subunit [Bacteroidales bacterium]
MSNIFSFSVGKKLIMSLMGLFLIAFLVVHLGINLTLIFCDTTDNFNIAANFMGTNIVVKVMEITLFGGFFLHIIYGLILSIQNMIARPVNYKVANNSQTSFFSKYMFHTAVIIGIFLVLHLFDFYIKAKFLHGAESVIINGEEMHDLGALVIERFQILWVDIVYIVALLGLAFHLHHGFQSAFQTIGLNHPVYTPIVKGLGLAYTILVPLGFILIPVIIYIQHS